jgi:uncharacterized membrane protein YgcG
MVTPPLVRLRDLRRERAELLDLHPRSAVDQARLVEVERLIAALEAQLAAERMASLRSADRRPDGGGGGGGSGGGGGAAAVAVR